MFVITAIAGLLVGCPTEGPASRTKDTQAQIDEDAPWWPEGAELRVIGVGRTHVSLEWPAARDNVAVGHYQLSKDGIKLRDVQGSSYLVTLLSPDKAYTFVVWAVDTSGNRSDDALTVDVHTTVGCPLSPVKLPRGVRR